MKKKNWIYTLIIIGLVIIINNSCEKDSDPDQLVVGQSYKGGYIAYILQQGDLGYDVNVQHGLIAALSDQGTTAWGCAGTPIDGTSTILGAGQTNTTAIVNGCSTAGIAARLCNDLVMGGYSDWYLPSKDELSKLYINKYLIGGFANFYYWSSSEYYYQVVWTQNFGNGSQTGHYKSDIINYVRAVRSF